MVSPAPRRRRRVRLFASLGGVAVVAVAVVVALVSGPALSGCVLTAQPDRTASWFATKDGGYTAADLDAVSSTSDYFFIEKFAENFDLQKQFADVKQVKQDAADKGRNLKVFMYINAQYWLNAFAKNWQPYGSQFQSSWILKDASGNDIPFYGQFGSKASGSQQAGYVVDLTNPAYRDFITSVALDWLKQAPLDGVVFDSAFQMVGNLPVRKANADGTVTPNVLLCGNSWKNRDGDCPRVTAWNQGLADLLSTVTKDFAAQGKEVIYNGVPTAKNRPDRNTALLADTNGASNESFCYMPFLSDPKRVTFTSMADDARLMQTVAGQGKKLIEISNYIGATRAPYATYCLGGFLMGWQPGSSYYVYHPGYTAGPTDTVMSPADRLNLGNPTQKDFTQSGSVLSRTFQRGVVAVNDSDSDASWTLPGDYVEFTTTGQIGQAYPAGSTIAIPKRSALFFVSAQIEPFTQEAIGVC